MHITHHKIEFSNFPHYPVFRFRPMCINAYFSFFFSLENFWNRFPLYRNHRHILWKRVSYNPFLYTQIHSESLTRNWYGLRLKCGVVKFDMVMIGCISTWCDLGYIGSDEVDFRILQWKSISTYRELWKFDTTDKRDFIVAELFFFFYIFYPYTLSDFHPFR